MRGGGCGWQEGEKDSITREKESVVFCVLEECFRAEVESRAHSLENLSPAGNKLDFKKRARSNVSTDTDNMWRQGREAILINKCHFCNYVHLHHVTDAQMAYF